MNESNFYFAFIMVINSINRKKKKLIKFKRNCRNLIIYKMKKENNFLSGANILFNNFVCFFLKSKQFFNID